MQQDYWGAKSKISYLKQKELTARFKMELETIRTECRERMETPHDMVEVLENGQEAVDWDKQYFECIKCISLWCSEEMAKLAELIIRESGSCLHVTPPCEFTAIAIGSLAKGEATPYSDLEFFFLIERKTPDIEKYFELLAMTTYFNIGNLGETKLSYMAIEELQGWFEDRAKNGFKIDGLSEGAGNIPTGNGKPQKHNHFIVTPQELADRYLQIFENPVEQEALRGDLTAMLAYIKPFYSSGDESLMQVLQNRIESHKQAATTAVSEYRTLTDLKMLSTDAQKFKFQPSNALMANGFNADVKREIYRFPSILLLDICIVLGITSISSWHSIPLLQGSRYASYIGSRFGQILSIAAYIRLSSYLYHNSQDDRMSVARRVAQNVRQESHSNMNMDINRWHIPVELYCKLCDLVEPLKECLARTELNTVEDFRRMELNHAQSLTVPDITDVKAWAKVRALYYSGNNGLALTTLKDMYTTDIGTLKGAKMLAETTEPSRLGLISEIFYMNNEKEVALFLMQHVTESGICDKRRRIAELLALSGNFEKAKELIKSIERMTSIEHTILALMNRKQGNYCEAEINCVQALQMVYDETFRNPLFDNYGNLLPNESNANAKIDLLSLSAEVRLNMVTDVSDWLLVCLSQLGDVYRLQGRRSLAIGYYRKCLEGHASLYGEYSVHVMTAIVLGRIGDCYHGMSEYNTAAEFYNQSLAMFRELSASGSSNRVSVGMALTLSKLGKNYKAMACYSSAESCYKQALAIRKEVSHGGVSEQLASTLEDMTLNYHAMGCSRSAEDCNKQAVAMCKELAQLGVSQRVARVLYNSGNTYREIGDYSNAEDCYYQALAMRKALSPSDASREIAQVLHAIGYNYNAMSRYSDAENWYKQALAMQMELAQSGVSNSLAGTLEDMALNYDAMGCNRSAENCNKQAAAIRMKLSLGGVEEE